MNRLGKLFLIAGIFLTIVFVVPLFLPAKYTVNQKTIINAPVEKVYNTVVDLKKWEYWAPWTEMTKNANFTNGENGRIWAWKDKEAGAGSIEIIDHTKNISIRTKLVFQEPYHSFAYGKWSFKSISPKQTQVIWTYSGNLKYPLERYAGLTMNKTIAKDLKEGLSNLKEYCENKPNE